MKEKSKLNELKEIEPARLDVHDLSVSYGIHNALNSIDFSITNGERVAIIGPNGAGKSTLFKALTGLIVPDKGEILVHGQPLGHHNDCVAFIPQREEIDWMFPVTVQDVVQMGRYRSTGRFKGFTKDDKNIVIQSMEQMQISELAGRPIGDLSGGQQQRVFIARSLAQKPHVLLMDEPFDGIDIVTQDLIWILLDRLHNEKVTVLIATHDLNLASQRFDSVMLLNRNLISIGLPLEVFTKENLLKAYGEQIMYIGNHIIVDQCCPGDIK